jgi:hypothetical protein
VAQIRRTSTFTGAAAADPLELAFLQHAQQLGLEAWRDVADLVEEQRAAVRQSRNGPCVRPPPR